MDEAEAPSPPPFLEVKCQSSGMKRRFAKGTEAGFAVSLINKKLGLGDPLAAHIEAFKEGEEPISFGPSSALVDYGNGWGLQTVSQVDSSGIGGGQGVGRPMAMPLPGVMRSGKLHVAKRVSKPEINFMYIGKIILAFILIFVLGAIFTLALENLPRLIYFFSLSM
ncbi:hypothetical protein CerSpe_238420 [Prunus speciosa]